MEFQSKCGDCEAMANLQHKCVECGVSLCNKCKKRHGKKSGLSKHTVVKKETPKPVKRNVCRDHTPNEYQMFCDEIECQVPVCLTCISNTHKKHQFIELKEAEKKKKELFETMKEDLITKQLAHLSKTLKDIKRNREIHAADAEIFYKEVNEHKGILVDEIERVFEQFKSEFEESKKFDETLMDEQSAGIEKRISDIKSFLEDTQANVKVCEDPCTLICYIQDTQEEYRRKIDSEIQRTKCSLPRYSPVPVEQSQIRDMCGNMKGGVRDVVHVERNEALSCSSFGADSVSLSSLPESDSVVVAED